MTHNCSSPNTNHSAEACPKINVIVEYSKAAQTVAASGETRRLADDFKPSPLDVICRRGKTAYEHNVQFREALRERLQEYSDASSKLEKSLIVSSIVESIREASPDGGFVREECGVWYEVGDAVARERVGAQLRDMLHTKYRSSTKAKREKRAETDGTDQNQQSKHDVHESKQDATESVELPTKRRKLDVDFFSSLKLLEDETFNVGLFGHLLRDISSRKQELVFPDVATTKLEPSTPSLPPPTQFPQMPTFSSTLLRNCSVESFSLDVLDQPIDIDFDMFRFSSDESAIQV